MSSVKDKSVSQTIRNPKYKRPKIALVSCGLGHIKRGVEVSTARWYEALKKDPRIEVRLFSGGFFPESTKINNIPRDFLLNTLLSPAAKLSPRRVWEFCYGLEQMTFAAGFGSALLSWQPDIVWTKETPFAHVLAYTRPLFNLKYKLIFSNGCGFKPATYEHFDFIQHLHRRSFDEAKDFGIAEQKMIVLPNIMSVPQTSKTQEQCRQRFGYSSDDYVIMCAAAWNCYHKRIDYLIEEVSRIANPKVKLLLCGQPEADTTFLKQLAARLLPQRVQWHTLPAKEVPEALKASDIFILPSLEEVFGGVLVEAMMLGLPVIAHQTSASLQFSDLNLPNYDLSKPGNLASFLQDAMLNGCDKEALADRAKKLRSFYDEQTLRQQFIDMVQAALNLPALHYKNR